MNQKTLVAASSHLTRHAPNYALAASSIGMLGTYALVYTVVNRAAVLADVYAHKIPK